MSEARPIGKDCWCCEGSGRVFSAIDAEGEVCPLCKGAGELKPKPDLKPDLKTDLAARVKQSLAAYAALSPVDRAIHEIRQRQSYVRGEMRMPDGKLGGATEEALAALPKDPAVVLADEVERLRQELTKVGRDALKFAGATLASIDEGRA